MKPSVGTAKLIENMCFRKTNPDWNQLTARNHWKIFQSSRFASSKKEGKNRQILRKSAPFF
jgi:hypothetical protein